MTKRIVAGFLCLALLAPVLAGAVRAQEGPKAPEAGQTEDKGKTDQQRELEEIQKRFIAVLEKVKRGEPVEKKELEFAKGLVQQAIDEIESGRALAQIMAKVEEAVDKAIAEGRISADQKEDIMAQYQMRIMLELGYALQQSKALLEFLDKAKVKEDEPKK